MRKWLPILIGTFVLGLAAAWQWSPLHEMLRFSTLEGWAQRLAEMKATPLWVLLSYTVGGLLSFPHGLLIWATAFTFPPAMAILYGELGTLCSSIAVYFVGRKISPGIARRVAGSRLEMLRAGFAKRTILSVVVLHFFPMMPFSMLNLVAGGCDAPFRDFVIGTILGATPGIVLVCLFGHRLLALLQHPNWKEAVMAGGFLILAITAWVGLRRWLKRIQENETPTTSWHRHVMASHH